jgi:uncharacterized repeat protein (TIGR03803 family)
MNTPDKHFLFKCLEKEVWKHYQLDCVNTCSAFHYLLVKSLLRFFVGNPKRRVSGAIIFAVFANWTIALGGGVELTVLASLDGANGSFPEAVLVSGSDGKLYGTAHFGGTNGLPSGYGTVFSTTTNGIITPLASFAKTNGSQPMAGLVQDHDGCLYGTTSGEPTGTYSYGTVFRITTNGELTTLVAFRGFNGRKPQGALIQAVDGNLYGTTSGGGSNGGYGTVFKMTTNGALTTLVSFGNTNGGLPASRLLQATDGKIYGTTVAGGMYGYGTVFALTTNGTLTTLASFNNTNGAGPYAGLVEASDGHFYGTTRDGGTSGGNGTIFRITATGTLTKMFEFDGTSGSYPYAGLLQGTDGNFYGTTAFGGVNSLGTVFMITPAGKFRSLVSFDNTNGNRSYAGLIQSTDGNFYGTTANGGANFKGAVFRFPMPAIIQNIGLTSDLLTFTWNAMVGRSYQLQYNSNLDTTTWSVLCPVVLATNTVMAADDSVAFNSQRFYRVVLLP